MITKSFLPKYQGGRMKKSLVICGFFLLSSVLAGAVTIQFKSNKRSVDTILKNGKLLVEVGELSFGLGVQYVTKAGTTTFTLGKKAKTSVPSSKGGAYDWDYVDPFEVAKDLSYSAKLEKVTDAKTKVVSEVLMINYLQKITCNDFVFWEDAQKFFNASANILTQDFDQRDPFNIDPGKDGLACEFLPRAR
jgi:hypothetical protein